MAEKIAGVYCLHNINRKKIYIGSSMNIRQRARQHIHELKLIRHFNEELQLHYILGDTLQVLILEGFDPTEVPKSFIYELEVLWLYHTPEELKYNKNNPYSKSFDTRNKTFEELIVNAVLYTTFDKTRLEKLYKQMGLISDT